MLRTSFGMRSLFILSLLLLSNFVLNAQRTIYGVASDSAGRTLEGVLVRSNCFSDSTKTNAKGEYQLNLPDSCNTLLFTSGEIYLSKEIDHRTVINVVFPSKEGSKEEFSMNPRKDYPLGIQLTLAGHSLFAVSLNYFLTENQSIELGVCGMGLAVGTRRYFSLNDYGRNSALYLGAITNLSPGGDFVLYVPFGYHILSKNGMAFGLEVAGRTPQYIDDNTGLVDFLGFGINFGFQF